MMNSTKTIWVVSMVKKCCIEDLRVMRRWGCGGCMRSWKGNKLCMKLNRVSCVKNKRKRQSQNSTFTKKIVSWTFSPLPQKRLKQRKKDWWELFWTENRYLRVKAPLEWSCGVFLTNLWMKWSICSYRKRKWDLTRKCQEIWMEWVKTTRSNKRISGKKWQ